MRASFGLASALEQGLSLDAGWQMLGPFAKLSCLIGEPLFKGFRLGDAAPELSHGLSPS